MNEEFTLFSQQELDFLRNLIKNEIQSSSCKPHILASYHSLPELRLLIIESLVHLKEEFGSKPFRLPALAHVLSKYTTLRPGDYESQNNGIRWENQIGQVVLCEDHKWPYNINPFEQVSGNVRGCYRLRDNFQ